VNKSLTIVLPVYNAESRLRKNVSELLEVASELTPKFGVLIIDDGSTDATLEVAEELAAHYPQVVVRRHRHRRGLGAAIDYVQRRVRSDAVMLHDGVTPVNPEQMRSAWQSWIAHAAAETNPAAGSPPSQASLPDLASLTGIHNTMERAHQRVLGFQLITCVPTDGWQSEPELPAASLMPRADSTHLSHPAGVGQIPPLPRPKFLSAVAAFALGE
jgi:hypothetical protein